MIGRAVRALERAGCPVPTGADALELSRGAREWNSGRTKGVPIVEAAASVLEAAGAIAESGDQIEAAIALGTRFAGFEAALSGVLQRWAKDRMRERKAGRRAKEAAKDYVMKTYGAEALAVARQIVAERFSKFSKGGLSRRDMISVQKVLEALKDRCPDSRLPKTLHAIRDQIGDDIKQMIDERLKPPRVGRRRRV